MSERTVGSVTYKEVGKEYFAQRGLKRYAKVWSLWALGVGAVISGHYSGWNLGLANGFGSMLVALFVIAAMYWGLIFCLAEMSPALPHTGAAYSFARSAMGPWGGMVTGSPRSIEYILTPAVIVYFIGTYMTAIFETPPGAQPVWWIGSYVAFLALNLRGVELSFRVSVVVTLCALAVLAIYWGCAIPYFDLHRWALNHGPWLPQGFAGVLAPFLSPCGFSSRSSSFRSPPRNPPIRSATCRRRSCSAWRPSCSPRSSRSSSIRRRFRGGREDAGRAVAREILRASLDGFA
jgi:ethanolamine permease